MVKNVLNDVAKTTLVGCVIGIGISQIILGVKWLIKN